MSKKALLLNDKDFDTLTYNVMRYKNDVNILNHFPTLQAIQSFREYAGDRNKVIKYIVLCYDKGSPIMTRYMQDSKNRKVLSAQYAGFNTNKEGLFDDEVDLMMKCMNKETNTMIIDFIRTFNDPTYSLLMTGLESYYQKLEQIISAEFGGKRDIFQIEETKGKLFKQAQEMSHTLQEAAHKILTDENPYLQRDLYCIIDSEQKNRLNITPERMLGL
ncbi:MAG: hypothetical protein EBV15_03045 [Bacteroidetes bacterium]|jgi:hypothetical protein|nr:hypothetical protein [Bacteroidota bacterium]